MIGGAQSGGKAGDLAAMGLTGEGHGMGVDRAQGRGGLIGPDPIHEVVGAHQPRRGEIVLEPRGLLRSHGSMPIAAPSGACAFIQSASDVSGQSTGVNASATWALTWTR